MSATRLYEADGEEGARTEWRVRNGGWRTVETEEAAHVLGGQGRPVDSELVDLPLQEQVSAPAAPSNEIGGQLNIDQVEACSVMG